MSEKTIHEKSWLFQLLLVLGRRFHRFYYRKFTVVGLGNVPENEPVIFVSNHQNALMDALAIIFSTGKQVVFLARADIFKKPFIAKLLYFLKILPVYRFRDGIEHMSENDKTFLHATKILRYGTPIALFPEGNHGDQKKLRPLKKGVCRIAFRAEELSGFELGIKIVPVGLDYTNWQKRNQDLLVQFGNPIELAGFIPQYKENPAKAMNELLQAVSEGIRPLMIDIQQPDERYEFYMQTLEMQRYAYFDTKPFDRNGCYRKFQAQKELIRKLDDRFCSGDAEAIELEKDVKKYQATLSTHNLKDRFVKKVSPKLLLTACFAILTFPLHLIGFFLNYIPYKLPYFLIKNAEDTQFHSSLDFAVWFLSSLVYYLILIILALTIFPFCPALCGIALGIIAGLFTVFYSRYLIDSFKFIRFLFLKISVKKAYYDLLGQKERILSQLQEILRD